VRLNAVAWSLLFPLGLYVLARRIFDESTARVTLLLAAVPPFLMTYYSTVAEPHFETNTFGVVLLLLALVALTATAEPRRARALACLGFVAGIACWTNMKAVVVLGPVLALLLVRDPRLPMRRGGLLLGAGFVVGSLPASLFYLTQPDPGQGSIASARRFLVIGVNLSWPLVSEFLVNALSLPIGAYYFGPFTPLRIAGLVLCGVVYLAAVAVAGADAARALRGRLPARRAWGVWALLLVLVATFAALYLSGFNTLNDWSRGRYLLPAYIPLFILLGAAVVRLGRRSRLLAGVVLAFVLAFHFWTNLDFLWPFDRAERARRGAEIAVREAVSRHVRARPPDAFLLADERVSLIWQFLLGLPVVSALFTDPYYPSAVAADAAGRVTILATQRDDRVAEQLDALGVRRTETRWGAWRLYEDVHVSGRLHRLVPRDGWRALGEPDAPPAAADGDLGTAWPSRRLDASESGALVLDLGAPRALARVVLWPTAVTDLIVPLEVAGSPDGVTWERLGVVPERVGRPAFVAAERPLMRPRNGWLEVRATPRPVRFLRVSPVTAGPVGVGMVAELFAYEALDGDAPPGLDLDGLLAVLRARGVTRLLADPVVSARVALRTGGEVATLPANGALNNHGLSRPLLLSARLRLRETDAALVAAEDAGELSERLAAAGVAFASEAFGSRVLFRLVGPLPTSARCQATDWRLAAEVPDADGRGARYLVEGSLPEAQRLAAVHLEHPRISTRHVAILRVELSDDGRAWRAADGPRRAVEWAWAGRTLFAFSGGATDLILGGAPGRAVRVEVRMPYRGEDPITSLCVRGAP
jgi:4-amino-4-deoxy-L-arabinose transferase-like glycosyltransferase